MPNILQKKNFVCSDLTRNNNKFWIITLYDNYSVKTEWGRLGHSHDELTKSFSSTIAAEKFFNSKIKDKLKVKDGRRDAYTEIDIINNHQVVNSTFQGDLAELAAQEIETVTPEVKDFVRWLAKANIHNILSSTTIKYNINEGSFSTPLGVIGQKTLNEAKDLLEQISKFTNVNDKNCITTINQYIRRIPQDLGGSATKIQAKHIFGTPDLLQRQLDIIEGLETAITSAKPTEKGDNQERIFNTRLDICKDDKTISEIRKKFNRFSNGHRISCVYEVDIKDINDRFMKVGLPVGNIERLWHGTKPQHILSIFKEGLKLPSNRYTGNRFGNGIYFSDRSDMSLGYTQTNSRNGKNYRYMFLSDIARGNIIYTYSGGHCVPAGYNSRWMEKNSSTSQIIVYNTNQIQLLYLVEIEN